jgi:hypothetical protein
MAWSVYRKSVADVVSPPDGLILFCGMPVGFADTAASYACSDRAPLAETVAFLNG